MHLNSEYPAWQHVFLDFQIMHPLNGDGYIKYPSRPILLTSHFSLLFYKIILFRIEESIDREQPNEQAGFRRNYGTMTQTLNDIVQIHHLRFADDIVLIGKNHNEVAQMLLDIEVVSIKIGLKTYVQRKPYS